jgi:hypothetical protein
MEYPLLTILFGVMAANGLSACIVYGAWRANRNERDIVGLLLVIVPLLIAAASGFLMQ